ncbi:hypothetical protein KI688_006212 [Linnemannia hyalina]|uniref:Uncharacterized protein n=1 Tax=Linnemannia hyalina TaxID=64524 RepID=A0A9P8BY33_9FUNG|nr:hypothetical protein KI688_006212 [Linnemannia hyalina]
MPSTHFSPRLPINPPPASAGHHHHHHRNQSSVSSFISAGGAMIGIDSGPRKTAAEKAAERDWQEQARQIFQLSTVSAKGHFLPPSPSPLELGKQGSNDRFKDNDTDYFTTIIISTSPERVRTFLSTESSISPAVVVGQDKENSKVAATPPNLPPPYVSAVAIPVVAAIPAAIPKRRVVAPADTLSTPPSIDAKYTILAVVQLQLQQQSTTAPSSPPPRIPDAQK